MFEDVEHKLKKGNSVLFSRESECLREFRELVKLQKHRTLVAWALDCAGIPLAEIESKYPLEKRPRAALELCEAWAGGKAKMPEAKRAILAAHAAAKEIGDRVYAALCHAVGHAGATVHVETHALGLPFYELTALVHRYGKDGYEEKVLEKIDFYCSRLEYWRENTDRVNREWAAFLKDDGRPNKEKLLDEKRQS